MKTPDEGESAQQALRLAQLEIKMLREQLRKAMEEATSARGGAQKTSPGSAPADRSSSARAGFRA